MHYIGLIILLIIVIITILYFIKISSDNNDLIIEKYNTQQTIQKVSADYLNTNGNPPIDQNSDSHKDVRSPTVNLIKTSTATFRPCQIHFNDDGTSKYVYEDGWQEFNTLTSDEDKSVYNVPYKKFANDNNNIGEFENFNETTKCFKLKNRRINLNTYKYKSNDLIKYKPDSYVAVQFKNDENVVSTDYFMQMFFDKQPGDTSLNKYKEDSLDSICSYNYKRDLSLGNINNLYRLTIVPVSNNQNIPIDPNSIKDGIITAIDSVTIKNEDNSDFIINDKQFTESKLPELLVGRNISYYTITNGNILYRIDKQEASESDLQGLLVNIYKFNRNLDCSDQVIKSYELIETRLKSHLIINAEPYISLSINPQNLLPADEIISANDQQKYIPNSPIAETLSQEINGISKDILIKVLNATNKNTYNTKDELLEYILYFILKIIVISNSNLIPQLINLMNLNKLNSDKKREFINSFNTIQKFMTLYRNNQGDNLKKEILEDIRQKKSIEIDQIYMHKFKSITLIKPEDKLPFELENIYEIKIYNIDTLDKTLALDQDTTCDVLVIGGGGAGGSVVGGGGGAGAVIYRKDIILPAGNYSIVVGNGGVGGGHFSPPESYGFRAGKGEDSEIFNMENKNKFHIKAFGGGTGGWRDDGMSMENHIIMRTGGSGGGSSNNGGGEHYGTGVARNDNFIILNGIRTDLKAGNDAAPIGAINTSRLPHRAKIDNSTAPWRGSGGGGAGGPGIDANGGQGVLIDITGVNRYYAAGGGGGLLRQDMGVYGGNGGNNIGGFGLRGGHTYSKRKGSCNAINGTGSGGGGGGYPYNGHSGWWTAYGGSGGSGIVIVRYKKKGSLIGNKRELILDKNSLSGGLNNILVLSQNFIEDPYSWKKAYDTAINRGKRLPTITEIRKYIQENPLEFRHLDNGDFWTPVENDIINKPDWMQIGNAYWNRGISHIQELGSYPSWGNNTDWDGASIYYEVSYVNNLLPSKLAVKKSDIALTINDSDIVKLEKNRKYVIRYDIADDKLYPPLHNFQSYTHVISGQQYGNGTYIVSASSSHPNEDAFKIFNYNKDPWTISGRTGAYGGSPTGTYTGNQSLAGYVGEWVKVEMPVAIKLTRYIIEAGNIGWTTRVPAVYKIFGSNNNTNWIELVHKSNPLKVSDYIFNKYEEKVSTSNYFKYFALVVNRNVGLDGWMSIGQFYIYGLEQSENSSNSISIIPDNTAHDNINVYTYNSLGNETSYDVNFNNNCICDILIVGGGGGGGQNSGGGGGAGGLVLLENFRVPRGNIKIIVGKGGNGGTTMNVCTVASKGNNSSISINGGQPIIAYGGGGGFNSGGYDSINNNGSDGGSGGGAAASSHDCTGHRVGGKGIINQGNNGGNGIFPGGWERAGAGGGGAGGHGNTPTSQDRGGDGGIGKNMSNLFGTNVGDGGWFAGGGGGSSHYGANNGIGGKGGGGNATDTTIRSAAKFSTGGGGGASRGHHIVGGQGGSGVVIIKIKSNVIYQTFNNRLKFSYIDEDIDLLNFNNVKNNKEIDENQVQRIIGRKSQSNSLLYEYKIGTKPKDEYLKVFIMCRFLNSELIELWEKEGAKLEEFKTPLFLINPNGKGELEYLDDFEVGETVTKNNDVITMGIVIIFKNTFSGDIFLKSYLKTFIYDFNIDPNKEIIQEIENDFINGRNNNNSLVSIIAAHESKINNYFGLNTYDNDSKQIYNLSIYLTINREDRKLKIERFTDARRDILTKLQNIYNSVVMFNANESSRKPKITFLNNKKVKDIIGGFNINNISYENPINKQAESYNKLNYHLQPISNNYVYFKYPK